MCVTWIWNKQRNGLTTCGCFFTVHVSLAHLQVSFQHRRLRNNRLAILFPNVLPCISLKVLASYPTCFPSIMSRAKDLNHFLRTISKVSSKFRTKKPLLLNMMAAGHVYRKPIYMMVLLGTEDVLESLVYPSKQDWHLPKALCEVKCPQRAVQIHSQVPRCIKYLTQQYKLSGITKYRTQAKCLFCVCYLFLSH